MSTLEILSLRLPTVVDLRTAARETGFAEQTIRNSLHKGKCPFRGYKDGSRWKFRLQDLADYIDKRHAQGESQMVNGAVKRGRPTKKQEVARRQAAEFMLQHREGAEK